jgi:hypothetical protein
VRWAGSGSRALGGLRSWRHNLVMKLLARLLAAYWGYLALIVAVVEPALESGKTGYCPARAAG